MNLKLLSIFIYLIFTMLFIEYLFYPNSDFPAPLQGSLQSTELADTEISLRRAYFVNNTREEVISHYQEVFNYLPTLRLNYPPEEAQTIIRDQTRSSYLEELTHPFRESIYINGFVPTEAKDEINVNGQKYDQKITVRYVPSKYSSRLVLGVASSALGFVLLIKEWPVDIKRFYKHFR